MTKVIFNKKKEFQFQISTKNIYICLYKRIQIVLEKMDIFIEVHAIKCINLSI